MWKMVFYVLSLTAAGIFFVVSQGDGLRAAARTGDVNQLMSDHLPTQLGGSGAGGFANLSEGGAYEQPWYAKLDPRQLWRDRPKMAKLKVKTIKAPENADADLTAQLAAQGLSAEGVTVVKID